MWSGALLRMGDHRLPKRVVLGELENAGKRGPGGKEKQWTDYATEDQQVFDIIGNRITPARHPGVGYSTIREGADGLWPCGGEKRKRRPQTGRGIERQMRPTRLRLHLG